MLNDEQRELFCIILDLNYKFDQETGNSRKFELFAELNQAKIDLRESMGSEAYNSFMNKGREMFAPA